MALQTPSITSATFGSSVYDELHYGITEGSGYTLKEVLKEQVSTEKVTPLSPLLQEQIIRGVWKLTSRRFTKKVVNRFPLLNKSCPLCQTDVSITQHKNMCDRSEHFDDWMDGNDLTEEPEYAAALEYCSRCSYWRLHHLESLFYGSRGVDFVHNYTSLVSKLHEFTEPLPESCSQELARWIRRNPTAWHTMNPRRFEQLVADIFKANYAGAEAIHVGKPVDGGVDVVFIDADKKRWLIQAKRRESENAAEPVETIRNLLGTMLLEDATFGMVVSTADHFTYHAYDAVKRASERGLTVKLTDRGKLDRMLDPLMPKHPWVSPLRHHYPYIALHLLTEPSTQSEALPIPKQLKLFKRVPRLKNGS